MAKPIMLQNSCYVYEIIVDDVVRYIGKGTGKRAEHHIKFAKRINKKRLEGKIFKAGKFHNRLAKAIKAGAAISFRKISENLSSKEAFEKEIKFIANSKSELWNETAGGEGLSSEDAKRLWKDPNYKKMMKELYSDPVVRKRMKENSIKYFLILKIVPRQAMSKRHYGKIHHSLKELLLEFVSELHHQQAEQR